MELIFRHSRGNTESLLKFAYFIGLTLSTIFTLFVSTARTNSKQNCAQNDRLPPISWTKCDISTLAIFSCAAIQHGIMFVCSFLGKGMSHPKININGFELKVLRNSCAVPYLLIQRRLRPAEVWRAAASVKSVIPAASSSAVFSVCRVVKQ